MMQLKSIAILAISLVAQSAAVGKDLGGLIERCERCHGQDGNSEQEEVPTIAGFSVFYITDAIDMYKEGTRKAQAYRPKAGEATDMHKIAGKLSNSEKEALGNHYAALTFVPHKQEFDPDFVTRGARLHGDYCEKCHAEGGTSPEYDAAILAGQWMAYLRKQIALFDAGERVMPRGMERSFSKIGAQDRGALLHYYASQH
jgi:sulfide dehydrogenase cytochrome subunit